MVKNSYISLHPSSSIRNDALNSIKYTLLLNYEIPELDNMEHSVQSIMESCHNCCRGLFQDASSTDGFNFYFFGNENKSVKPYCDLPENLSYFDSVAPTEISHPVNHGFPAMILQHCVLSSYHSVLTDLLNGEAVTSYELNNKLRADGFYSLYKKNKILFPASPGSLSHHIELNIENRRNTCNSRKSSQASDFARTIKSHLNKLPGLENLFCPSGLQNENLPATRYCLQFSGIFYCICQISASDFNVLDMSKYKENYDIEEKWEKFQCLTRKIFGNGINHDGIPFPESVHEINRKSHNPVDNLYSHYISERILGLNLICYLIKSILNIEKVTPFRLCQDKIIEVLCHCQKLPNVFSRQYFLQYAFNKLITRPMSYLDFWSDHVLHMDNPPYISPPARKRTQFQFTKWLDQFELFCTYMGEYVIPIYEWCFINLLMGIIEHKYPDQNHMDHLLCAINILTEYIKENYKEIIHPITLPQEQCWVDTVNKYPTGIQLHKFPPDSMLQLLKLLSPMQVQMDLNLPLLSPGFFKKSRFNVNGHNESYIRDFYINLLMRPG